VHAALATTATRRSTRAAAAAGAAHADAAPDTHTERSHQVAAYRVGQERVQTPGSAAPSEQLGGASAVASTAQRGRSARAATTRASDDDAPSTIITLLTSEHVPEGVLPPASADMLERVQIMFSQPGFSISYNALIHKHFTGSAKRLAVTAALRELVKTRVIRCERGYRKDLVILTSAV
jgi:hypothetical protein